MTSYDRDKHKVKESSFFQPCRKCNVTKIRCRSSLGQGSSSGQKLLSFPLSIWRIKMIRFGASKSIGWTVPARWGFWCIQGARAEWSELPQSAANRHAERCCFLHSMWSLLTADWPGCWKSKETFAFWHLENGYALVELCKWLCGRENWIATW